MKSCYFFALIAVIFCSGCAASAMLNRPADKEQIITEAAAHKPYLGSWVSKEARAEAAWNEKENCLDITWIFLEKDKKNKESKKIPIQAQLVRYASGETFLMYQVNFKKIVNEADYNEYCLILGQPFFFLVKPEFQSKNKNTLRISFVSFKDTKENKAPVDPSVIFLDQEKYRVGNTTEDLVRLMSEKKYTGIGDDHVFIFTKK